MLVDHGKAVCGIERRIPRHVGDGAEIDAAIAGRARPGAGVFQQRTADAAAAVARQYVELGNADTVGVGAALVIQPDEADRRTGFHRHPYQATGDGRFEPVRRQGRGLIKRPRRMATEQLHRGPFDRAQGIDLRGHGALDAWHRVHRPAVVDVGAASSSNASIASRTL
jgi:hypothetical protein